MSESPFVSNLRKRLNDYHNGDVPCDWALGLSAACADGLLAVFDRQQAELERLRSQMPPSAVLQMNEAAVSTHAVCTCETMTLMRVGCQCGSMEREANGSA